MARAGTRLTVLAVVLVPMLAPPCANADLGTVCDLSTWLERAWCNLEVVCSTLAPSRQPQILIEGALEVQLLDTSVARNSHPGTGKLTVEADREVISAIMAMLINNKIKGTEKKNNHKKQFPC